MKSLAFSLLRTVLDDPGATSQSDLPRSLPIQSDPLERRTKVARDHRPWSDLPRATHRGRSHLTPLSERPPKATPRGRSRLYGETTRSEARSDLSERSTEVAPEGQSDLSERHAEIK
ncbi:hypothetical protein F2Q68_00017532 [Brassica cretica]|uniref:Uncharacterized protein n=1 Tax=Brassica cretica TaxID=69181 RepID=A0A8S9H942_BRACR|nr:hypothetical protein F2Q68_00017532 [Brassica cretica]